MNEIQLRIIELEHRLDALRNTRRRGQQFNHREQISALEGEISGLKWTMIHCFNPSTPNVIEQ